MTGNTFDGNSRGYLKLRQNIVGVVPLRIAVTKIPGTPSEDLGVNFPTLHIMGCFGQYGLQKWYL